MKRLPLISYHGGHSGDFCDHASGSKEQMLLAYLNAGYSYIAITEHMPPINDLFLYLEEINKNHSSDFLKQRFGVLFNDTRQILKDKFKDKFLDCRFGFETEFCSSSEYPNPIDWIVENIRNSNPDIVVASVHHVNNIPIDYDSTSYQKAISHVGDLENLYCAYYDSQYELIKAMSPYANKFPVVLGHMDVIRLLSRDSLDQKNTESVWTRIKRNIKAAKDSDIIVEVNSRALKKGLFSPYPSKEILMEIKTQGGLITISDDSHSINDIGALHKETIGYISTVFDAVTAFVEDGSKGFKFVKIPIGDVSSL